MKLNIGTVIEPWNEVMNPDLKWLYIHYKTSHIYFGYEPNTGDCKAICNSVIANDFLIDFCINALNEPSHTNDMIFVANIFGEQMKYAQIGDVLEIV